MICYFLLIAAYHRMESRMSGQVTWLSRKEAAAFLRSLGYPMSPATLARLAIKGRGPRYTRFGWQRASYSRDDVAAWAKSQSVVVRGDMK